jgi:hypothetical protein
MGDWYEYPTNFSGGTEVTGPAGLFFDWPNYILNSQFGVGLTLIVWIMVFTLSMSAGSRKAMGVACLISFMFSLYFVGMGGMNLVVTIGLLILGAISLVFSSSEGGTA